MLFKRKKPVDERIQKRSNEITARLFPLFLILDIAVLIIKIVYGLPVKDYLLDMSLPVIGLAVWLVEELRYGTLMAKKDDALKELSCKAKAKAYMAMFWVIIFGEVVYILLIDKEYYLWVVSYFIIWFPTALYITIATVSEGLMIFGSKKKETNTKKSLAIRTFIGSLFFGAFVGSGYYLHDGIFDPKGLIAIPLLAASWGIPFYLLFVGFMKLSEKKADKKIENEN